MDNTIIYAILFTGAIGLVAAALLVTASKLMFVRVDPKITELRDVLPGANCGACGFSGCDGYAAALAENKTTPDKCPPGGDSAYNQLCKILGVETGAGLAGKAAVIICTGDEQVSSVKMNYYGVNTCLAEEQHYGGRNACAFGCLGNGDCAAVCPSNAICITDGIARIDMRKCTGCGLCVSACPKELIVIKQRPVKAVVLCKNTEKGAVVRKKCTKGCIACMKCVKECHLEAISIEDSLAVIDSLKCDGCGHCTSVCITKCIASYE